ncbi:hypothetical protein DFH09DRAFT_1123313 [Mycena vulgaris]|nr:hypothetical protein DFH09DRAFT_1123313 [Mycena vulgaris]
MSGVASLDSSAGSTLLSTGVPQFSGTITGTSRLSSVGSTLISVRQLSVFFSSTTAPAGVPSTSHPNPPVQVPSRSIAQASAGSSPPMTSFVPDSSICLLSLIVCSPSLPGNTTIKAVVSSTPASSSPAAASPSSPSSPAAAPSSSPAAAPPSGTTKASGAVKSSSSTGGGQKTQSSNATKSSAPGSTAALPTSPSSSHAAPPAGTQAPLATSFTGTTTSTITDAPESTLSSPSFVSVVVNGKTSFTAPPLITILSTSSEANGSFVTFTHVVANPTGFSQAISGGHSSFFHNAGAVAGVFLVAGVIVTAIAAFGIFFFCRRRRRRRERHRRWLMNINRPRPITDGSQDPFDDARTPRSPPMRSLDRNWNIPAEAPGSSGHGLGLYDVPQPRHDEHPEEHERYEHTERRDGYDDIDRQRDCPSIYPASLPPANDDHDHTFEEAQSQPQRYSDSSVAPPRPRRSHLRDLPSKAPLITPPSSVSSHSPTSDFGGPFGFSSADGEPSAGHFQLNDIIQRRTLLNVCPVT